MNGVYFPTWRVYDDYHPSRINVNCVTHVFYAFWTPGEDGSVISMDHNVDHTMIVDGVHGCIGACLKLKWKNSSLKVLVSIGGGANSKAFSTIASDPNLIHEFASNIEKLVKRHEFDGVDIDWEHPSSKDEGIGYTSILKALRSRLPHGQFLITTALPGDNYVLNNLDLHAAAQYLDFVNLMAYDFVGPWTNGYSGHHAQLYGSESSQYDFAQRSGASGVQAMVQRSVPPHKIVLGIPIYGRVFRDVKGPEEKCRQSQEGEDNVGDQDEDVVPYRDLPERRKEGLDKNRVAAWSLTPQGDWITHDNVETVRMKAHYARPNGLAGLFYWEVSADKEDDASSLIKAGWDVLRA